MSQAIRSNQAKVQTPAGPAPKGSPGHAKDGTSAKGEAAQNEALGQTGVDGAVARQTTLAPLMTGRGGLFLMGPIGAGQTATGPMMDTALTDSEDATLKLVTSHGEADDVPVEARAKVAAKLLARMLGPQGGAPRLVRMRQLFAQFAKVEAAIVQAQGDTDGFAEPARLLGEKLAQNPKRFTAVTRELTPSERRVFASLAGRKNIHAFVRRVMMEAYQISMLVLDDMAREMERLNESRKKLRAKKNKLADAKASGAASVSYADLGLDPEDPEDFAIITQWQADWEKMRSEAEEAYQNAQDRADHAFNSEVTRRQESVDEQFGPKPTARKLETTLTQSDFLKTPVVTDYTVAADNDLRVIQASHPHNGGQTLEWYQGQLNGLSGTTGWSFTIDENTPGWIRGGLVSMSIAEAWKKKHGSLDGFIQSLSPEELYTFVRILGEADYLIPARGFAEAQEDLRATLAGALNAATVEQVQYLNGKFPPGDTLGNHLRTVFRNNGATALDNLPGFLASLPNLEGVPENVKELYVSLLYRNTRGDLEGWMDTARTSVHNLDAGSVQALFTLLEQNPIAGLDLQTLASAIDPGAIVGGEDPEAWAFLEGIGGGAAEFVVSWRDSLDDWETRVETWKQQREDYLVVTRTEPEVPAVSLTEVGDGELATHPSLLDAHERYLEKALEDAEGDVQMRQFRLQQATEQQQQLMNALTNMSKAIHDTIMAIVRNLNG